MRSRHFGVPGVLSRGEVVELRQAIAVPFDFGSTLASVRKVPRDSKRTASSSCATGVSRGAVSSTVRGCFEAQGSAAVGSAGTDLRWRHRGWSSYRSRSGRAIRCRYDGGGSTTSPKSSLLGGRPKRELAHPTDRVLGGAGPSRSRPESGWVPGGDIGGARAAQPAEERVPFGAHSPVHRLPWCPVDFFHAHQPHGSRFRGSGALGVGCIRLLAFWCASVLCRLAGCRSSSS